MALCFSAAITTTTATGGKGRRRLALVSPITPCYLALLLLLVSNKVRVVPDGINVDGLQAAKVLGAPTTFDPAKLTVQFAGRPAFPRAYTLSHCDFKANLTLTVSESIR